MNITPLHMDKIFFTDISTEINSHIELRRKNGKQTIGVQVLLFQGCEYHIVFENEKDCLDAMDKLFRLFNPSVDINTAKNNKSLSGPHLEVLSKKMINPIALFTLVQSVYPQCELIWTPTTIDISKAILAINFCNFSDYLYSPDTKQSHLNFNCIHLLHSEIKEAVAPEFNVFIFNAHWASLVRLFASV